MRQFITNNQFIKVKRNKFTDFVKLLLRLLPLKMHINVNTDMQMAGEIKRFTNLKWR